MFLSRTAPYSTGFYNAGFSAAHLFYRNDLALCKGLFGNLVSDSRQIRDQELSTVGLVVMDCQLPAGRCEAPDVLFMDHEVGQRTLKLERGGRDDGASADMDLDPYVMDKRHIADLFHLGDSAACADVRLCDLDCLLFKELLILPSGENPLPAGDREPRLPVDIA